MKKLIALFVITLFSTPVIQSQTTIATKVPIEYHRGHIYLNTSINSKPLKCVFDTGADFLYLDSLYYNHSGLNFSKVGNAMLPGAGRTAQKVKVIMDKVNLVCAESTFEFTTVPIFSLKTILGDVADALVGTQQLRSRVITFDFIGNEMGIYENVSQVNLDGFTKHKYEFIANRIYLPITLTVREGLTISGKILCDMGAGGGICLTSHAANKFSLDSKIDRKLYHYTQYGGVGGYSESVTVESDSLDLLGYKIDFPFTSYSLDKSGALSSSNHLGLLGNEVLSRFDIVIDFTNQYLYLKPNSENNRTTSSKTIGFSYVVRDKTYGALIVTGLYKNSEAQKQGLKIDDRITEVNGRLISEINYKDIDNLVSESDTLKIKVVRGTENLHFDIPNIQIAELMN